jgi:hypothetical protein
MTTTNFDAALGNDPRLLARWEATREKVLADARAAGFDVDPESLKNLPGVKLAVFTDMGLPSDLMEEIKRLPAVQEQLKRREMLAQLDQKNSALHAELSRLPPAQRMEIGRQIERQRPHLEQAAPQQLTAEQEAERIIWIRSLPPAQRIAAARAAGLC